MIKITLPFPPSVNSLYGGGSAQKRFPSKKYKEWLLLCPKLTAHGQNSVHLTYKYYFKDNRDRDCENFCKAVSDYLVKQKVIEDDNWKVVKSLTLIPMGIDRLNPRVEIEILPVGT